MAKDKSMEIKILPLDGAENVGVMIDGELCMPDDVVTVPLSEARSLIHRERAIPASESKGKKKPTPKPSKEKSEAAKDKSDETKE